MALTEKGGGQDFENTNFKIFHWTLQRHERRWKSLGTSSKASKLHRPSFQRATSKATNQVRNFATWKARKPRVMTNRKFVINLQNDLSTLWTSIWTWLGVARWLSLLFLYSVYLLISDLIFTPASFLVLDVLQLLMLETSNTKGGL